MAYLFDGVCTFRLMDEFYWINIQRCGS